MPSQPPNMRWIVNTKLYLVLGTWTQSLLYTNYYKALLGPNNFRRTVVLCADICDIKSRERDTARQTALH